MKVKELPWIEEAYYHVMKPDNFCYEYYVGENAEYNDKNQLENLNGYYFCVSEELSNEIVFDDTYDTIEEAKQAAEKWHHDYLMEQFEQ